MADEPRRGRSSRHGASGQAGGGRADGGQAARGQAVGARRPTRAGPAEQRNRQLRQVQPPAGVDPQRLDPQTRQALRSLVPETAERVAAHLVAAGDLLDDDPARALEQARAARAFASRVGVVREATGLAAYAAGEWHEALAELRAARRLTGSVITLPVMADCERGLGRPDRALELARSDDARMLDEAGQAEMLIVASGARRDLGQADAAVNLLQSAGLDRDRPTPWSVRLWYAYADALLDAGRRDEALEWFDAVTAIDDGSETDAEERLLALHPPPTGPPPQS